MRVAGVCAIVGTVSVAALAIAWAQTRAPAPAAPTAAAAAPAATAPAPAAQTRATAAPAPTTLAAAPPPAVTPMPTCSNPNALGLSRVVEIDTTGGPGFGWEHFKMHDFLRDHEVVLTFDDGPWPSNTPAVLKALE